MLMQGMGRKRGLFGAPFMPEPSEMTPEGVPQFAKPNTLQTIAGVIGDTLSTIGGGQPSFLPGLAMQRQLQVQGQQAAAKRTADFADFTKRRDYEVAHPLSNNGTALQQNYEYLKSIDPAAAESYLRTQTTAPPIVQQNPDGTKTVYPAGLVPQGGAPQQPRVIQQLPPGVKPLGAGGATPSGSRSFPIR